MSKLLSPQPAPAIFPVEYVDADGDGIRIAMEPAEETGRACWVVRNSWHVNPCHEFSTPEAAYAAHQAAQPAAQPVDVANLMRLSEGVDPFAPGDPDPDHIERLAEIIREVHGNHNLGVTILAEQILAHPGFSDCHDAPATLLQQQAAPAPAVAPGAMEALTRLYWWGGGAWSYGYSADVVLGVRDWINGGMAGDLPPLPAWVADRCPPLPQAGEGEA
jgi:hypothetical protein